MFILFKKTIFAAALFWALSLQLCLGSADQSNASTQFQQQLNLILNHQDDQSSWLAGGTGRYQYGDHKDASSFAGEWDIGLKHEFTEQLSAHIYTQAQFQNQTNTERNICLIEWFLRYQYDLSFDHELTFKFGHFFFPSSFENINSFWDTPYTLSYSSLNSWIGEEFRPIGLDLQYRYHGFPDKRLTLASTIFGGNDSMGALLAWRGWSYGRVKTGLGDVLALPPLVSLDSGGEFDLQRDDGTRPFGKDLDGRAGFTLRSLYESELFTLNLAWVDNLGDGRLHHGEYAWRTRFFMLGASIPLSHSMELITEATKGNTRMGVNNAVDVDFYSAYLMLSYLYGDLRFSIRHDRFKNDDKDSLDQENNDKGRSHTLAIMWQPSTKYRAGIELLFLESARERTLLSSTKTDDNSVQFSALLQYHF